MAAAFIVCCAAIWTDVRRSFAVSWPGRLLFWLLSNPILPFTNFPLMELETERLILRPWQDTDAECLYTYAKDSLVGPVAGWPPHTSVENSREIIRDVLSVPHAYAVVLKSTGKPVGCIGLMIGEASNMKIGNDEGEIGYWIGVPYWGQGLIPEAVKEVLRFGFEEMGLTKMWCGYFEGNEKSRRVQEKCGFVFHHTNKDIRWELMNDIRTVHVSCLTLQAWEKDSNVEGRQ